MKALHLGKKETKKKKKRIRRRIRIMNNIIEEEISN